MADLAVAGSSSNTNTTTTKATQAFETFKTALYSDPDLIVYGPRDVAEAAEQGCIDRLLVTATPARGLADQVTSLGGEVIVFTEAEALAQHEFLTLFTGLCAKLRYPMLDPEDMGIPDMASRATSSATGPAAAAAPRSAAERRFSHARNQNWNRSPALTLPSIPAWVAPTAALNEDEKDEELEEELEAMDAIYPAEHALTSKTETLRVGPRELLVLSRAPDTGAAAVLRVAVPVSYPDAPLVLALESAQDVLDAAGLVRAARELLLSDAVLGAPALYALTEIVDDLLAAETATSFAAGVAVPLAASRTWSNL